MTHIAEWNDAFLDRLREQGDPVADTLVAELMRDGNRAEVSKLMKRLTKNGDTVPDNTASNIQDYFNNTARLPDFIDYQKIATAQRIYQLYNLEIGMMLMYAALPACYAAKKGAQVLMLTERMSKYGQIQNRLSETGQFILDVMGPSGFGRNGGAIRSAQKVRLVHAMVRYHITQGPKRDEIWDDAWGFPVNQEDMAGTMLAFSVHVLNGLDKIGIILTDDEKESFYHLWRVVGHLLGIEAELIPVDHVSAENLAHAIADRHFEPSDAGRHLTRVILDLLESSMPSRLRNYPHAMMRFCLGDDIADIIGVNPHDWTRHMVETRFALLGYADSMRYADNRAERLIGTRGRQAVGKASFAFISGMTQLQKMQIGAFDLPKRLRRTS